MTHRPDNGESKHLSNVVKLLPVFTALQPRRQSSSKSQLWEPHISPKIPCFYIEPYDWLPCSSPLDLNLIQINPLHTFIFYTLEIRFNIIPHPSSRLLNGLVSSGFIITSIRAAVSCPAQPLRRDNSHSIRWWVQIMKLPDGQVWPAS
jgi:hypothetical protein